MDWQHMWPYDSMSVPRIYRDVSTGNLKCPTYIHNHPTEVPNFWCASSWAFISNYNLTWSSAWKSYKYLASEECVLHHWHPDRSKEADLGSPWVQCTGAELSTSPSSFYSQGSLSHQQGWNLCWRVPVGHSTKKSRNAYLEYPQEGKPVLDTEKERNFKTFASLLHSSHCQAHLHLGQRIQGRFTVLEIKKCLWELLINA